MAPFFRNNENSSALTPGSWSLGRGVDVHHILHFCTEVLTFSSQCCIISSLSAGYIVIIIIIIIIENAHTPNWIYSPLSLLSSGPLTKTLQNSSLWQFFAIIHSKLSDSMFFWTSVCLFSSILTLMKERRNICIYNKRTNKRVCALSHLIVSDFLWSCGL